MNNTYRVFRKIMIQGVFLNMAKTIITNYLYVLNTFRVYIDLKFLEHENYK